MLDTLKGWTPAMLETDGEMTALSQLVTVDTLIFLTTGKSCLQSEAGVPPHP